jgi:hypothetical protein
MFEIESADGSYQLRCTDDGQPYELMARQRKPGEPEVGWVRVWARSYKWKEAGRPLGEGDRRTYVMAAFGYEWRTDAPEGYSASWYRREYHGGDIVLRRDTREPGNRTEP